MKVDSVLGIKTRRYSQGILLHEKAFIWETSASYKRKNSNEHQGKTNYYIASDRAAGEAAELQRERKIAAGPRRRVSSR